MVPPRATLCLGAVPESLAGSAPSGPIWRGNRPRWHASCFSPSGKNTPTRQGSCNGQVQTRKRHVPPGGIDASSPQPARKLRRPHRRQRRFRRSGDADDRRRRPRLVPDFASRGAARRTGESGEPRQRLRLLHGRSSRTAALPLVPAQGPAAPAQVLRDPRPDAPPGGRRLSETSWRILLADAFRQTRSRPAPRGISHSCRSAGMADQPLRPHEPRRPPGSAGDVCRPQRRRSARGAGGRRAARPLRRVRRGPGFLQRTGQLLRRRRQGAPRKPLLPPGRGKAPAVGLLRQARGPPRRASAPNARRGRRSGQRAALRRARYRQDELRPRPRQGDRPHVLFRLAGSGRRPPRRRRQGTRRAPLIRAPRGGRPRRPGPQPARRGRGGRHARRFRRRLLLPVRRLRRREGRRQGAPQQRPGRPEDPDRVDLQRARREHGRVEPPSL